MKNKESVSMTALSTSLKLQNILKMKFLHTFQVIWGTLNLIVLKQPLLKMYCLNIYCQGYMCKYECEVKPKAPEKPGII